ncbi:THO complex subunit 1 [Anthonomus grandis grandis]|uniref:THO complex subunit 1 n=1 Tax=Anthonomus grandis grandis TaxID=2921223 RepID=UPI0021667715|nr:THO complex subunit 1 [Anthonomus grandis grandis]
MPPTNTYMDFDHIRREFKETLKVAFKNDNITLLENKVASFKNTELDIKTPLDQAFRDLLLDLLTEEVQVTVLKMFVDLSIKTCRMGLTSPTMPVVLLGDIFDTLTLDICQDLFSFVEDNVHIWKEELFFAGCKNNLLRLCNDLLRRLSRTTATVFCGKILLFLARFFPFSERSGLNIVSEFNLENTTEYGTDTSDDIVAEIVTGDQKHVIDFSFYCKFWQLQDFFRNPNQCYDKVQWKVFCSHSMNILSTFHGIKLDYLKDSEQTSNVGYFAKYLTSQKLLDLQLHDVSFRRSVLLQFLIVFQYLTSSVKFKSDSFELKPDQKEWIQTSTEKVYSLLRETPPDGANFAKIIKNILKREELWNSWKNDGCPEIKKFLPQNDPVEIPKAKKTEPLVGDLIKAARNEGKFYMGSKELTKLWNKNPINLEACKGKDFLPTMDEFFGEAIAQFESGVPVKDEDNLLKDGHFGWRALRLLARRSPYFFSLNTQNHPLPKYLELMVHKMAHEKPGRNDENSQEATNEQEIEENILTEAEDQNTEDFHKPSEEFVEENNTSRQETKNISDERLLLIIEKIAPDWEKLGTKLGYKSDEIEWFKNENPIRFDQARHMMKLWFEDDEDANLDNLLYILEGLEMNEAAEAVRSELNTTES